MGIKIHVWVTIITVTILLSNSLMAQQDSTSTDKLYKIVLKGGSEMIGTVVSEDSLSLNLRTLSGMMMNIPKDEVLTRKELTGKIIGESYLREDPNYTRLLFAPTARSLESGTGYIAVYELFFAFAAVGIGDVVTLAGGVSLFPGAESQILYFAPKITPIQFDGLDLAVGVLHLVLPSWDGDDIEGVGIIYTNGTFGSRYSAATIGLGWGYSGEETSDKPILMIGGEQQLSNSIKLITENWFPQGSGIGLISLGIRFFGDRLSADLGFWTPVGADTEGSGFLPWVSFIYNFGNQG